MSEAILHFQNPRTTEQLYCGDIQNIAKVETALGLNIVTREDWIKFEGDDYAVSQAETFFKIVNVARSQGVRVRHADFENMLKSVIDGRGDELLSLFEDNSNIFRLKNRSIVPKTFGQKAYVKAILENDIVFGIGPAGTGKTFLAVAAALTALLNDQVEKIIFTRPAVEAGEALGFLPGDLNEKLDPYIQPLKDSLYDLIGREYACRLEEKGVIEIAPLAYMRGRTLSNAFVVLDEAQNTTPEQMMMFLTRLGESSRMIVTGDITQIDLPRNKRSGLKEAMDVLSNVDEIIMHTFDAQDVVRNPLVQKIIAAYQDYNEVTGAHQRKDLH